MAQIKQDMLPFITADEIQKLVKTLAKQIEVLMEKRKTI